MSILSRLIDPANGSLNRSAAEAIPQFRFSDEDQQHIATLAERSNDGQLGEDEAREYDAYVAAAELLALLQSKSRLSLKQQTSAA